MVILVGVMKVATAFGGDHGNDVTMMDVDDADMFVIEMAAVLMTTVTLR